VPKIVCAALQAKAKALTFKAKPKVVGPDASAKAKAWPQ